GGGVARPRRPPAGPRGNGGANVMKILAANLGSTSFKYRLFDMADERVLARGGVERIGSEKARCYVSAGGVSEEALLAAPDHAAAVRLCLRQLSDPRPHRPRDPSRPPPPPLPPVHPHRPP